MEFDSFEILVKYRGADCSQFPVERFMEGSAVWQLLPDSLSCDNAIHDVII
jgi:hypothetical protein